MLQKNSSKSEKLIKINQNKQIGEPWMTKGLTISSKRIYKLYCLSVKKHKEDQLFKNYIEQRNKLNSLKRTAKLQYYKNSVIIYKNNSKKLWTVINEITRKQKSKSNVIDYINVDGIQTYNKFDFSNAFCKFFSDVGKNIADNTNKPNKHFTQYISVASQNSIYFYPTDEVEIEKIINKLNNTTSFGCDKINNVLIKQLKSELRYPLQIIFNLSLLEGKFPDKFKFAHLIPIHKAGSKHEMTNYRPISLLTSFSKILEKIIYTRVYNFLENEKLFNQLQFGFRKNCSTIDAVTFFLTKLIPSLDKKEYNMGLFVDLSKAFDSLDHNILLLKLEKLGIRGVAKQWFKDYLTDRKQAVRIYKDNSNDYTVSDPCGITHGIPQGSILGPLLFNIYIYDIDSALSKGTPISFADDTTILISNNSFEDLFIDAYEDLHSLLDYLNANKLSINLLKTKYILFRPNTNTPRYLDRAPKLFVKNIEIEQVEYTKFLGIYIDSKLNWNYQINNILNKLKQNRYIFACTKHFLPIFAKKLLFNAHVLSHCMYGALLWGASMNETQVNSISKIINKILLFILNENRFRNTNNMYKRLNCLKLEDIIELQLAKFMFNISNNIAPSAIQLEFNTHTRQTRYNTRNRDMPNQMECNSTLYNKSFIAKSNTIFRYLPVKIKNANNVKILQREFKKYKINMY